MPEAFHTLACWFVTYVQQTRVLLYISYILGNWLEVLHRCLVNFSQIKSQEMGSWFAPLGRRLMFMTLFLMLSPWLRGGGIVR